jgi:hypothetical protein
MTKWNIQDFRMVDGADSEFIIKKEKSLLLAKIKFEPIFFTGSLAVFKVAPLAQIN